MNNQLWKSFETTGSVENYLSYKSNVDNKSYNEKIDNIDEEEQLPNNLR